MEEKYLSPNGKKSRGLNSDHNSESGWKSPVKLMSPIQLMSPILHTKTIYLHEWWLMRPEEEEGIAVGGFTFRKEEYETMFYSAPIQERHDHTTLESSDGFTIYISGLINRSESEWNGFAPEVCSRFITGFPCNWDDFTSQNITENSNDGSHSFPPGSFKEMPYLQRRDLLLFGHGFCNEDTMSEHLFNDLLEKLKPAVAMPDVSRDKKSHETGEDNSHTSFKLDGKLKPAVPLSDVSHDKKSQETGKDNRASLKLHGVCTRRQLRSLEIKEDELEEVETKSKIQKVKA